MSGNATEEGLLLQVNNPSHVDPARFGFLSGGVVFLLTFLTLLSLMPGVTPTLPFCLSLGLSLWAARKVSRRIAADRLSREVQRLDAQRQAREAEAERQIAAMKRGG